MSGASFWENSWKNADPARLAAYADRFDYSEDALIRLLKRRGVKTVCDAGCGCGVYALKLALHGFSVSGFDLSPEAAAAAKALLSKKGFSDVPFRAADLLNTGDPDASFDAAVARDVLDHLPIEAASLALRELLRIVKPGGCVLLTLDLSDEEYETEPHETNAAGDYCFTAGKWAGMVFHPYSRREIERLTEGLDALPVEETEGGFTVLVEKPGALLSSRKLSDLQPSQFYISEEKLQKVERWFDPADLKNFEPIPVKLLDGEFVMTDGHTRAAAALRAGLQSVPLCPDEDELDWEMYRVCVAAAKERGVFSPADLLERILPKDPYEEKWNRWCDKMQAEIRKKRASAEEK